MTHICVNKQTIIGSNNGLSPGRRQAIIWTNAGILLIGTLGTNFSEILIEIRIFSFKKMGVKVSSAKWRPFLSRPQCVKYLLSRTYKLLLRTPADDRNIEDVVTDLEESPHRWCLLQKKVHRVSKSDRKADFIVYFKSNILSHQLDVLLKIFCP